MCGVRSPSGGCLPGRRRLPAGGWVPPVGRLPGGGRSPSGGCGSPPRGARSISFSAEKETGLDSKEKGGPVYGGFLVVHGGLRLYALFGDQPRPLRPCHCETGKRRWFYPAAAWRCHSRGRVRHGAPSSSHLAFSRSAARDAPDHPGPERGTRRRRMVRASACPCSTRAGRNGRKGSFLSYESRKPPFSTLNLP